MTKRALISVYDKEGIVEFAQELQQKFNYEIVSTGGTYKALKDAGLKVIETSELTGFTELLNGRVKTLHPSIHAGILADRTKQNDIKDLENNNIDKIDMVVVNLYPFEEVAKNSKADIANIVENIDIGGVCLLRAAAKNYFSVTPVFCHQMYKSILTDLTENNGETSYDLRKELAIDTFGYVSSYDLVISTELRNRLTPQEDNLPDRIGFNFRKKLDLRYGENPQQKAALYEFNNEVSYELLQGKELSYNNIVDMSAAIDIVKEFPDVPAVSIIKHKNPCGVALGADIETAYIEAFDCDPISAFGGVIGSNRTVCKDMAKHMKEVFLEVVIAPNFTDEALEILKAKKNLRLVKVGAEYMNYSKSNLLDVKLLPFGALVQTSDDREIDKELFKVATKAKPTTEQVEDMVFAWKICKHVSSNAIVVAKNLKAVGIGVGQTSRVASMELALKQACDMTKDAVIASDGFFPAIDNIQAAAQSRIAAIIQPGGSIKDSEVIAECDKYKIAMITTSIRHFKH